MVLLLVFIGAGIGGVARYAFGGWVQAAAGSAFPMGTLVVNVSGALALGLVLAVLEGTAAPPEWRALVAVGFCGGYTTFSTFGYETLRLVQGGEWGAVAGYVLGSVLLSLAGVLVGLRIGGFLLARG